MKTCAFFGHSMFVECRLDFKKLKDTIKNFVLLGFSSFLIGTHGEFDNLCLKACLELKKEFSHIEINKVYTSFTRSLKEKNISNSVNYISYPIELFHYKQRITQFNIFMVDDADVVICYVDETLKNSGVVKAIKYAYKQNKIIYNLFE